MRRYASIGDQEAPGTPGSAGTDSSILGLTGGADVICHIYEIIFGSGATPTRSAGQRGQGKCHR
jgi:hypothetical protein